MEKPGAMLSMMPGSCRFALASSAAIPFQFTRHGQGLTRQPPHTRGGYRQIPPYRFNPGKQGITAAKVYTSLQFTCQGEPRPDCQQVHDTASRSLPQSPVFTECRKCRISPASVFQIIDDLDLHRSAARSYINLLAVIPFFRASAFKPVDCCGDALA